MQNPLPASIKIDPFSEIPKYQQLLQAVCRAIENGDLKQGDKIPSLNAIKEALGLSRDTVLVAFKELQAKGIIVSTPGKGYYVQRTQVKREYNIFLLFDELNGFKEILYKSFLNGLKGRATVDMYFHYFNKNVFRNLIGENRSRYNAYVIMPAGFKNIHPVLEKLPHGQVFLLDQLPASLVGMYPAVYQHFHLDTLQALEEGQEQLARYKRLVMVYPGGKEPVGQLHGYEQFCAAYGWEPLVFKSIEGQKITPGTVYIVPNEHDLVYLLKYARSHSLRIGRDIGIISYNEHPLKEVVADGITTISTDFHAMGQTLARMVLNREKGQVRNPSSLHLRQSL